MSVSLTPATAAGRAVLKNEHLYFYKSHTDDAGARESVRAGGAETRTPGQRHRQPNVEICIWTHTAESIKSAGSIPFLRNFSSEESWARRRSISPITFLRGVHSHGAPGKANSEDYSTFMPNLPNGFISLAVICWIKWVSHLDLPLDQDPPCLPSPLRYKPEQLIKSNHCFETELFHYLWFHLGPLFHNGPLYLSDL